MRKLTLTVPEQKQIDINNNIYTVNLSDVDILNRSAALQERYANIASADINRIRLAVNDIISLIDDILGDGATLEISDGMPVNMNVAIEWLRAICEAVGSDNDDYIADVYE